MRSALYSIAVGNFAVGIGAFVVAGVLPAIAADFDVPVSMVGRLVTVYALAYALSSPVVIALTGRLERRTILLFGMTMVTVGNGLVAVAPSFELLYVGRVVTALGGAAFTPIATAVAALLTKPEERGQAIALVYAGFAAATALGIPAGTYVGLNLGWRLTFGVVSGLGLVSLIFVWWFVPRHIEAPVVNLATLWKVLRQGALVWMLVITLVHVAAQMTVFTYITPYTQALTMLGATGLTLLFLTNGVAGFFGNLISGRLTDRLGTRPVILGALVLLMVALVILPLIEVSVILGGVSLTLWGLVGFGFNTPHQARLISYDPPLASAVLGLNSSFLYMGVSAGAAIGGVVVDRGGLLSLPWVGVGLVVVTMVLFGVSYRFEERRGEMGF